MFTREDLESNNVNLNIVLHKSVHNEKASAKHLSWETKVKNFFSKKFQQI